MNMATVTKTDQSERLLVYRITPATRSAKTKTERIVLQLLDESGAMDYGDLVSQLSSFLYTQEVKIGGWALDLGIFGASLFVSEARHELELGNGILWEIDSPRKDSNELLSNLSRNDRSALSGDWRRHRRGA
jgi:hypothetical protein